MPGRREAPGRSTGAVPKSRFSLHPSCPPRATRPTPRTATMPSLLLERCGQKVRPEGKATMEDTHAMDEAAIIERMQGRVGRLTDDEVALVRTLTPADLAGTQAAEHLKDLFDLLTTVRNEEAMAEYVYAIA